MFLHFEISSKTSNTLNISGTCMLYTYRVQVMLTWQRGFFWVSMSSHVDAETAEIISQYQVISATFLWKGASHDRLVVPWGQHLQSGTHHQIYLELWRTPWNSTDARIVLHRFIYPFRYYNVTEEFLCWHSWCQYVSYVFNRIEARRHGDTATQRRGGVCNK